MDQAREDYDDHDAPKATFDWGVLAVLAFLAVILTGGVLWIALAPEPQTNI